MFDICQGWAAQQAGLLLNGLGNRALLSDPMTAFFSSRTCPATAIRAGLDWAVAWTRVGGPVIGGFHSPLERSVMTLLLEAGNPLVVVISRDPATARFPAGWRTALRDGGLAVISTGRQSRLTARAATARNDVAAALATEIVVAHASAHGRLAGQILTWQTEGMRKMRMLLPSKEGES